MSFESKFVGPASLAPLLVARLGNTLAADPHHGRDRVHSVYFDTREEPAAEEVRNGDHYKTKVRLRWYASSGAARAWVECKRKFGARRSKMRHPATGLDPAWPLQHRGWRRVAELLKEAGEVSGFGHIEPTLHLAYRRRRFVHRSSGLRVAVDDDIRLLASHPRLGASAPPRNVAHRELVLEIKGDQRDLPAPLAFIRDLGLRRGAFSKYGICRGVA